MKAWPALSAALLMAAAAGCRPKVTSCGPSDAGCDGEGSLVHGDVPRTYRYHLPKRRAEAGPGGTRPLILALHGSGATSRGMEEVTHFDAVSDEEGFVVAYPDGLGGSWNDGRAVAAAGQRSADDLGFLSALIDRFVATYAVDPARVYVAGLGNGAVMSFRVACALAGKVTAVGAVAGNHPEALGTCNPARPIPVVLFADPADHGGDGARVLSAPDTFARWAKIDGCSSDVVTTDVPHTLPDDRTRTHRLEHPMCVGGAKVVFYSSEGAGYTWPGGKQVPEVGISAREPDASREMWRFFESVAPRRLLSSEVPCVPSAAP